MIDPEIQAIGDNLLTAESLPESIREAWVLKATLESLKKLSRQAIEKGGLNEMQIKNFGEKDEYLDYCLRIILEIFEGSIEPPAKYAAYASVSALLISAINISSHALLTPALERRVERQRTMQARAARDMRHVAPRRAALRAAILSSCDISALAPTTKCAVSIKDAVNSRLQENGFKPRSESTIKRALETILTE